MKEEWKEINGYSGLYEISNLGELKSFKNSKTIILKKTVNNRGYLCVNLFNKGHGKTYIIHQLVAEYFLNHKPCGMNLIVNHIDFDKLNNRLDNLEVISQRENTNKKHLKSSSKHVGVHWHKRHKKWVAMIHINGKQKHIGIFSKEIDAHNAYQLELK